MLEEYLVLSSLKEPEVNVSCRKDLPLYIACVVILPRLRGLQEGALGKLEYSLFIYRNAQNNLAVLSLVRFD